MTSSENLIIFDPNKVRFDLSLDDALALTSVRSSEEYERLKERLLHMRGQSYFFINILGSQARLIMTIITAEKQEITATYELDPHSLGIDLADMLSAGEGSGNYPLPPRMEAKIKRAIESGGCGSVRMTNKY